jgi:hypothetical protein
MGVRFNVALLLLLAQEGFDRPSEKLATGLPARLAFALRNPEQLVRQAARNFDGFSHSSTRLIHSKV